MVRQPLQNGIMRAMHLTVVFGLMLFAVGTSINAFLLRLLQKWKYQANDIAHDSSGIHDQSFDKTVTPLIKFPI